MKDFDYNKSVEDGERILRHSAKSEETSPVVKWLQAILSALVIAAYYILLFAGQYFFDGTSAFYRSVNIFSGAGDPDPLVRILSCIVFFYSVNKISRFLLDRFLMLCLEAPDPIEFMKAAYRHNEKAFSKIV